MVSVFTSGTWGFLPYVSEVSEIHHPASSQSLTEISMLNAGILKERRKKRGGDTYIDVICIDVVICAFQNDPCGIICRGRQREAEVLRLHIEKITLRGGEGKGENVWRR